MNPFERQPKIELRERESHKQGLLFVFSLVERHKRACIAAVSYQTEMTQQATEGRPSQSYLNLIRQAARQRGLPTDYITRLDRIEVRT